MLSNLTTRFIGRLRARDPEAWFELWEIFGPVLRAQFKRWGQGRIGPETIQDLSQETLAALSNCIDRHDPSKGARFSTWLLAIAKHVLGDEMDRRNAQKRGSGKKTTTLDESLGQSVGEVSPDAGYEAAVFRAKVEAALRKVEKEVEFLDFTIYRMRIFDGQSGKEVAAQLGMSEPTVSRRLARVRELMREHLKAVVQTYSFTEEEFKEADRKGLSLSPNKAGDALFDEALAEIFHAQADLQRGGRVATGAEGVTWSS